LIKYTGTGLFDAASFDYTSNTKKSAVDNLSTTFYSAAHVQGIGSKGSESSWITTSVADPVPEPGTIVLLSSGFLGLCFLCRKKFKK